MTGCVHVMSHLGCLVMRREHVMLEPCEGMTNHHASVVWFGLAYD